MGIYIKYMKMPNSCVECPLYKESVCDAFETLAPYTFKDNERASFCPLTEVAEPHGRLIDADACIDYIRNNNQHAWETLSYAPTIIEGSTEVPSEPSEVDIHTAYSLVFQDLQRCSMFTGLYDAKNGSSIFMNGISTVMESIAYVVSEEVGDALTDLFIKNMVKCEEEASAEAHDKRTETHGVCSDLISRADAIEAVKHSTAYMHDDLYQAISIRIPSADRPTNTPTDLISRADAIDALGEEPEIILDTDAEWEMHDRWVDAMTSMKSLPSAEADWIPCSERLPSDSGNYLITVADFRLGHIGEHTVTIADFYAKGKKWNSVVDVVAWMPLPDPWKDGEEK